MCHRCLIPSACLVREKYKCAERSCGPIDGRSQGSTKRGAQNDKRWFPMLTEL
ncbi:hypothetical protein BD310DRAFT_915505 [Dichomitus squalens]|uniref:Uncharacterized protein n=1 Tax=Dichomitus squalens TaxID=114155 RepID=A0A4Q9Q9G7_9APHY|nr:hypothetical protein BD310DRAFT_915505 [Dichomitus squalens]